MTELAGMKYQDQLINMKKLLTLFAFVITLTASAQTEYSDSLIYRIDAVVYYGSDTSVAPNYVRFNYHYITPDSVWESQLMVLDSLGNLLVPIQALTDNGAGASGTTWFVKLDSASVLKTPLQLCDSLFLPKYQSYIGTTIKL